MGTEEGSFDCTLFVNGRTYEVEGCYSLYEEGWASVSASLNVGGKWVRATNNRAVIDCLTAYIE